MSVIYMPLRREAVTGFSMFEGATRVAVVGPGVTNVFIQVDKPKWRFACSRSAGLLANVSVQPKPSPNGITAQRRTWYGFYSRMLPAEAYHRFSRPSSVKQDP